jgi:hypothetical protein
MLALVSAGGDASCRAVKGYFGFPRRDLIRLPCVSVKPRRPTLACSSSGSTHRALMSGRGQDGKRFLILVPVKKAPLELITNWQALLK